MTHQTAIDELLSRLAAGEPLTLICAEPGLPTLRELERLMQLDPELHDRVLVAKQRGWDRIAREVRQVARGEAPYSTGDVVRDKLIVDTDLKLLAKWDKQRYGDAVEVSGSGLMKPGAVEAAAAAIDAKIGALIASVSGRSNADTDSAS